MTTLPPRRVLRHRIVHADKRKGRAALLSLRKSGAGNESRTRDLNLGKVALYQLSYSRVGNRELYGAGRADCQKPAHAESTAAIAPATYSTLRELSAATQMRPVSIA